MFLNKNKYLGFAAPSTLIMLCIMIFPVCYAAYYSFFDYRLGAVPVFTGLRNYVNIIQDTEFTQAVGFSLQYTFITVFFQVVLGMGIALLMNNIGRGRKILSTLIYLPYFISATASGIIFRWIFMSNWGLLSQLLGSINVSSPSWFDNPFWAKSAVMLVEIWQNTPFAVIVFYAGLQSISSDQLEAASIDGAGALRKFWHITLPHLRHLLILATVMRFMDAFRVYDRIAVMTAGGPGNATESVSLYTYDTAFVDMRLGKACAAGVMILIMLAIPVFIMLKLMRAKEAD